MEVEKMKRFLSVCCLVIFSILVAPSLSTNYDAIAGRTVLGGAAGEYCPCGQPAPPVCYYDTEDVICSGNGNGNGDQPLRQSTDSKSEPTSVDAGSIGLLFLTALYLFRRFI
jgi:hypothetical protein